MTLHTTIPATHATISNSNGTSSTSSSSPVVPGEHAGPLAGLVRDISAELSRAASATAGATTMTTCTTNNSGTNNNNNNNNSSSSSDSTTDTTVERVKCLLEGAVRRGLTADCEDLRPYVHFGTGSNSGQSYTRNLIWQDERFMLVLLCWSPRGSSCIHAHSGSRCWAVTIAGTLREHLYTKGGSGSSSNSNSNKQETRMDTIRNGNGNGNPRSVSGSGGSVCYIDDGIGVHMIENDTDEPAISLHCYSPPFTHCSFFHPLTGELRSGEMSYHSVHGKLATPEPASSDQPPHHPSEMAATADTATTAATTATTACSKAVR